VVVNGLRSSSLSGWASVTFTETTNRAAG
jgi:hypothetical protein